MEHTVSPQGMAQAAVSRCCQLRDRQDASICGVAQPSWWLPVSGAVGHWGLVLGPSEETQEDGTCGRAKADTLGLMEANKVVCGGPWPSNPGKPA